MTIPAILFLGPNRVWRTYPGGKQLDILEGKSNPQDTHVPEDWIASTTRATNKGREHLETEGLSMVQVDGKDILLRDLMAQKPREMLGEKHVAAFGPNTQFLLKFLDSAVRLHIQCHPTIEFSKKYLNSNSGKTEAYVILGSREEVTEPYIHLGFQHSPEPSELRRAIVEQDTGFIGSCFDRISVKPGDVFIVPGGLPHAIGEGVFMIEIMEPTDFAVRIEFERGGYVLPEESRFMGRDVDFALSMFDFTQLSVDDIKSRYFQTPVEVNSWDGGVEHSIIDERATPCFRVKKLSVTGSVTKSEDSFYVGIVSRGKGRITCGNISCELKFGDKFLVPFATGEVTFDTEGGMDIVQTFPPSGEPK